MFKSKYVASALASAAVVAFSAAPAYAYVQPIYLEVNQSYYMPQNSAIKRIAVTNQKIADVKVINKHAINIVALASGSTSLTVWNANGMRQEFVVSVSPADSNLANLIQRAIGLPHVKVKKIGSQILLRGRVTNQRERELAVKIASMYLDQVSAGKGQNNAVSSSSGSTKTDDNNNSLINSSISRDDKDYENDRIINLLELENPDQINIEAEIVEINSNDAKNLGIEYGADTSSPGVYTITGPSHTSSSTRSNGSSYSTNSSYDMGLSSSDGLSGSLGIKGTGSTTGSSSNSYSSSSSARPKGSHWYNRNWLYTHFSEINMKVHALIDQGKGRIISQPNITTMSGKTAGILIGGKVPYPVQNGNNGGTSVDYQNYGIELDLVKPEVDRDGNVTSRLFASVSRLDWGNAVTVNGYNMPGIATRSAETMVNIPSGMTMAIGGLMNSDDSETVSGVPVLSKIPVLGELFKYHNKTKQKTEILILITPRVVNETTPVKMTPKMKDAHIDVRNEDQAMYRINLNESVEDIMKDAEKQDVARVQTASSKKKAEKQAQEKAKKQEKQKLSEKKDSILGKYLDQDVLQPAEKAN